MTGYTKAYRARASKVAALITKNPELPIFAEVDSEVVADDGYNTWFGEMRGAYITELWSGQTKVWEHDEAKNDPDDLLDSECPYLDEWESLSQTEYNERTDRWIETRPWTKCIVILVGTPDDL